MNLSTNDMDQRASNSKNCVRICPMSHGSKGFMGGGNTKFPFRVHVLTTSCGGTQRGNVSPMVERIQTGFPPTRSIHEITVLTISVSSVGFRSIIVCSVTHTIAARCTKASFKSLSDASDNHMLGRANGHRAQYASKHHEEAEGKVNIDAVQFTVCPPLKKFYCHRQIAPNSA
jgi:hypothetical protein